MIRLAWMRIWNRKLISIITILSMLCVFTLIPLGIYYAQESQLAVEHTITEHGRGTYDILIRPAGSRTAIEKELGVVEANYIGDSAGGISISEWNEIEKHPDIEIAAPVASIGYFAGNQTGVELPHLNQPAILNWYYFTSDGVNEYPIEEPVSVYLFENVDNQYTRYIDYIATVKRNFQMSGLFSAIMPENYYLLTAIDIDSEKQLTGIDYSDLTKYDDIENINEVNINEDTDLFILKDSLEFRGNPELIPVLKREDLNIALYFDLKIEFIDLFLDEYREKYNLGPDEYFSFLLNDTETVDQIIQELNETSILLEEHLIFDLSEYQSPFDGNYIAITTDYEIDENPSLGGGPLSNDTSLYYTSSKIDYIIEDDKITVPIVKNGSPPLYKNIEPKGESYLETENFEVPFMLWQVGTFTPPEDENHLVSSPLGIYTTEEVKTLNGTVLTPTISPGSFIAQPAAGVTTIEAAEIIKGDKPIDAIRIKVAGINSYDQIAQDKIDRLAIELLEMGYEVDIVAGSSFQQLEMGVEGIGSVIAPWTTLGVAQSLTEGWNLTRLISTSLFVLFGLAWFLSRLLYERNAISTENDVLATLGWEPKKVKMRNIMEQQFIVTISFIISLLILYSINIQLPFNYYVIVIGLWIVSILFIWIIFSKNSREPKRTYKYKNLSSIRHYRYLILPIVFVLTIATILMSMQFSTLASTYLEAIRTTLGQFTFDTTLLIQIIILIATITLALISTTEAIHSLINTRKHEFQMYHTIGWTKGMIRKHFGKEVSIWSVSSVLIGIGISLMILISLNMPYQTILFGSIITTLFISLFVFLIIKLKAFH